jgi:hypothetical protein
MTETNRYNNGKIYKLVSNHTDKIYVGSTCKERLCQRLGVHKNDYKEWLKDNNNSYISSYELFKLGDVEIILLESIKCETKDELLKKEREYIEKYKDIIVNKIRPSRTRKEYREDNKEEIKQYKKNYDVENKEEIKQYKKKYYEDNKDNILEKKKQIYDCECGSSIVIGKKAHHLKTLKHQTYLNSLQT